MAGKKTGKRLLTWVLVLVMALSLLPLNALADENGMPEHTNPSIVESEENRGAHLVKSATKNTDDTYTIQLESWVTGKVEQTTGSAPLDIVLVLDQSGSMAENNKLESLKTAVHDFVTAINENADKHNVEHRIAIVGFASNQTDGGSNWGEDGAWYNTGIFVNGTLKNYETYEGDWTNVYLTSDSKPDDDYKYSAYLNDYSIFRTKIEYDAKEQKWGYWSGFWGDKWNTITPKTDASDDNSDHIQVQRRAKAGYIGLTAADYQDALVKSSETSISTAIDNLSASGATRASYGMEMANNVFKNNDLRKGSSRVVVFFTDGEPGQYGYETSEAGRAIAQAYATKHTHDAKVFSVGMFDKTPSKNSVDFMNYVSSNYPNANASSNYWGNWTITPGGKDADKYYMTVEDGDLSTVFKQISGSILTSDVTAGKDTVLTDKLSQYFDFDGVSVDEVGTVTGVTVKKVAYQGDGKWASDGEDITEEVTVGLNGKTVTVSGFDYSNKDNVVTDGTNGTNASGYKLVVTFNVKPDTNYTNWDVSGRYPTNSGKATLAKDNDTFATVDSPNAAVDTYQVTYKPGTGTGNEYTDQYYLNGAKTKVLENRFAAQEGYEFDCWKDENDTTYQVGDEITFGKSNVILTAQWKEIESPEPAPATVTLKETDVNGNALINKHLTITAKEVETIKDAYFCVAVTAADNTTEAAFNTEPRYATTTTVERMTRTSDGTAVEGSFVFPEQSVLTFSEVGTYTFTVKEVFDEYIKVNHTTYDDAEYTMTVIVTKDTTENKLNAVVSFSKDGQTEPTTSITFNNTYKTPVIPTYTFDLNDSDIITVNKKFVSNYGRSATMSFTATATIEKQETYTVEVDPDFPFNPNISNNRSAVTVETYTPVGNAVIGTVTLKTDTTKAFDFDKENSEFPLEPGDYRITVQETKGNDRYVNYDTTPYIRKFKVSDDGVISAIAITITNEYTKRHTAATPSKPTLNTGDHYAYVMGYPDGTVRPNGSITRAEVSAILFRLLSDKTRDEYFTTESSFTDVKAGAWYNNSIATLEKAGVIVDTAKGGAFRPNEAITRAELAAMLAQFSDAKPVKGVKFSDVSAEHWAYEAIAIAAKMGWIEGYPDGTFRPDATITRAEMMTLVNRALERVPSDEDHLLSKRVMLTFPDCKSGDWFYIAVQEATNSHTYERAATEKNGDEQWTALRANRDWTQLEK